MRVLIRPAVVADAAALTDLHLDVWDEAYGELVGADVLTARRAERETRVERWTQILTVGTNQSLLAVEGGRLLGFASTGAGRDPREPGLPTWELMALYVRREVYGTGVGHALLTAAIGDVAAYLWVLDGNERAVRFYQRQGFDFDGRTKVEPVGLERRMVRGRPRKPGAIDPAPGV